MQFVGKKFTIPEFEAYVQALKFNGWTPNFVVVHNTASPSLALYQKWRETKKVTQEQWLKNLASYYIGKGWKGCPHLFVADDYIMVLNPLTSPGTHTPSWNKFTWGVETVGEFQTEKFDNGVKENLIAALGILHSRVGLNPADFKLGVSGLHFHKEDKATTHKTCPGKNIVKSALIKDVLNYMNNGDVHLHVTEAAQTASTSELNDYELTSVSWVQSRLNELIGAGLKVDGVIGPLTKKAVENFQKKAKLDLIDGIPGPITRKALKAGWQ
jgi:hypothetical protein